MSVVSAAPKWFMKLISQAKNIATCKLLTFAYPLCSNAYFENHECLFLLFPSVNFLTACQILETTVMCYCKCITNEKHTYIFGKSAVFSTRSDYFWRFILGVWWKSQKKRKITALIKVTFLKSKNSHEPYCKSRMILPYLLHYLGRFHPRTSANFIVFILF